MVAVDTISVTPDVKAASLAYCHLITLPVFPAQIIGLGVLPLQIVLLAELKVPATVVGLTVTCCVTPPL